ncbi:hypothetical protein ACMHYB_01920 [Sorangium sp. So ce1128]
MACAAPSGEEEPEDVAEVEEPISASSDFYCGYPTEWTLTNTSSAALNFSCTCPSPAGLPSPITMPTTAVASGGSEVYAWTAYHNDSIGLNACNWNCTAKRTNGTVYAQKSFFSNWGECLTLTAKPGGVLSVQF